MTLPKYAYIGDAVDVSEGGEIPVKKLTASTVEVTVKKAGNGVELTDEGLLSGYGDPLGEAVSQLTLSIASKLDKDAMACLSGIGTAMTVDSSDTALSATAPTATRCCSLLRPRWRRCGSPRAGSRPRTWAWIS